MTKATTVFDIDEATLRVVGAQAQTVRDAFIAVEFLGH